MFFIYFVIVVVVVVIVVVVVVVVVKRIKNLKVNLSFLFIKIFLLYLYNFLYKNLVLSPKSFQNVF